MKKFILLLALILATTTAAWSHKRFGETLCNHPDYFCITIKPGETWANLFPDAQSRDIVRRVNRMNISLRPGIVIAVPKNLDRITIYDVSPFPRYIESDGEKTIYVSQDMLAWGAYDESGELIWWGPISSGADKCPGVIGGCTTPTGAYRIIRKQDIDCISTAFPRRADGDNGGAEMPYCMHFFRGYALHGSGEVPGYRASHGCIRLFTEDARWLNEEFIDIPGGGLRGTRVIIGGVNDNPNLSASTQASVEH
ncbi:L,D-transpeptidase [Legionella jordanis]|uniref:Enhanced entry protein EnhA n=1 Tax=Legionella jordanis TaxID=456 RepID=A0A0W0VAH4_9GAMM|nr:L,D-transpeptidase [Legionella jordanis]KTD17098.1 enhanced entry protein EnhA [Legionella jordanis]RMX03230.1 L,D-transpeptidase [Legionella jordanis]RMX18208.1 L,D-transpeptidase [Legionella jordanis]VEH12705.1 enhanced entry protein EnhA [Legionella jordanis]